MVDGKEKHEIWQESVQAVVALMVLAVVGASLGFMALLAELEETKALDVWVEWYKCTWRVSVDYAHSVLGPARAPTRSPPDHY